MKSATLVIYVIVGVAILAFGFNYLRAGDHGWRTWFALIAGAYFLFRAYMVARTPRV